MEIHVNSTERHVSVMWLTRSEESQVYSHGIAEASNLSGGPEPSEWYLNRIKVNTRGQGYGSALLRALLAALATRENFIQLVVEPGGYGSDPDRLVKFYERHGFVRDPERECWVWRC